MLRKLVERLSRGVVIRRLVKTHSNRFHVYISPDAQLKYLKLGQSGLDPELVSLAESVCKHSKVIWDIGANVGLFTYAAAMCGANTVVCVEPDHWLVKILKRTRDSREFRGIDVRIIPAAVGDVVGIETLLIARRGRASNALMAAGGRSQMGGVRSREFCPTLTLDTILESQPAPDFLKIDVEGFENAVLVGGRRLLQESKPLIYIEIGREQFQSCYKTLLANDYVLYDGQLHAVSSPIGLNYFACHKSVPDIYQALHPS